MRFGLKQPWATMAATPIPLPKHYRASAIACLAAFLFCWRTSGASQLDSRDACQQIDDSVEPGERGSALLQVQSRQVPVSELDENPLAVPLADGHRARDTPDSLDGLLAPLNEAGYHKVASMRKPMQMDQFVRRTILSMGLHVTNPAALRQVVPRYSSAAGPPLSFAALRTEILTGSRTGEDSWVAPRVGANAPAASLVRESAAAGAEPFKDGNRAAVSYLATGSQSFAGASASSYSGTALYGSAVHGANAGLETGLGSNAALSESGYRAVLEVKDNRQMEAFMRRTIQDLGLKVADDEGLKQMVPYLSGEAGSSSFGTFKGKVLNLLGQPNAWVIDPSQPLPPTGGRDVPLSSNGYRAVASLNNNVEMVAFIERVVKDMGLDVVNHGGPQGLAPYFSGDKQVQSMVALKSEITRASKNPGSWVQPPKEG